MMKESFQVIGLMSGTSLDGVDLACCTFNRSNASWSYEIHAAETLSYTAEWKKKLLDLIHADAVTYVSAHAHLGKLYGGMIKEFIANFNLNPSLIASHGHTIFHQPSNGFTSQIGDGASISAITGIDTVCDFRSIDVALGGQGAPLVPFGDQLLFSKYKFCLNLGGIANITHNVKENLTAFDICVANMALNEIALRAGVPYDDGGKMAAQGKVIEELLKKLNSNEYFLRSAPKSLGREWYEKNMLPLLDTNIYNHHDLLKTICMHIGEQTGKAVKQFHGGSTDELLITGGGAFNKTLVECIRQNTNVNIVIPDDKTISYKEALIFAFLGFLYIKNEININNKVTGSERSHIGGALYKGIKN